MNGRRCIVLALLAVVLVFVSACAAPAGEPQVVVPSEQQEQSETQEPQKTPALPVTREDLPPYFLPGLSDIGVMPQSEYKIGMIVGKTSDDAAWQAEIDMIAASYQDRFGVQIVSVITGEDAGVQISAVADMLGQGIDFLIISPVLGNSLRAVGDMCEKSGVPYITLNRRIAKTPGKDGYVCSIEQDDYLAGVLTGISIVETMTKRYGAPRGNIGEIVTAVDDEASQLRSMGIRRVLSEYEELNVVISIIGSEDDTSRYKAASNVLKAFRSGSLHGIVALNDDTALQTLQAVLDTDREELLGSIWSMGATKAGLTAVWYKQFAQTIECTCQTGMVALEYALQYLEGSGDDIPPVVLSVTRVFAADTQEQRDAIASLIAGMDEKDTEVCFENMGEYSPFLPDEDGLGHYYPMHYFEYANADLYLSAFEPFTMGEPIYESERED